MILGIASVLTTSMWAGVVLGVSFVAQPAKFSTPGLARPIALATGRQMFKVTHRVESALAIAAVLVLSAAGTTLRWPVFSAAAILAFQIIVLMPPLSKRVDERLAGKAISKSPWHAVFSVTEIVKLALLLTATIGALTHSAAAAV
ncbi:hypothetical protein [Rugamonas sp.]|uniref:hypothetical protein n=1 Tax=Rugamonas sp. TaxID=1926287 RepID=UPI0025F41DFE|nr:hypothetical protein [Rugamonas sp.]